MLVRFKVFGFWYTINTGPSLRLFSDTLLLPRVMEILQLWFYRISSFMQFLHAFLHVIDRVVFGVYQLKVLDMALSFS